MSIGNLSKDDYIWIKETYAQETAQIIQAMELQDEEEQELMASLEKEIRKAKQLGSIQQVDGGDKI